MPRLLLLEDNTDDIKRAEAVARQAGFTEIEVCSYATEGQRCLENAMRGEAPFPDAIVIDLDLGFESGFELLRFWHGTPQLNSTPVVIWTMADEQREMCKLFGVERFVSKYEGPQALHSVLSAIIADEVSPASA